jgi:hypothetical protein
MSRVSPFQQQISFQEQSYGVRPAFGIFVAFELLVALWLLASNAFWILMQVSFWFHFPLNPYQAEYYILYGNSSTLFPVAVGILLLIQSISILVTLPRIRILLDPYGITIHTRGYHCYAPWSTIRGTTSRLMYGGLLLGQPAFTNISLEEGKRQGIAVIKRRWLAVFFLGSELDRIFFIPAVTGLDWRSSKVGVALRQYIPRI